MCVTDQLCALKYEVCYFFFLRFDGWGIFCDEASDGQPNGLCKWEAVPVIRGGPSSLQKTGMEQSESSQELLQRKKSYRNSREKGLETLQEDSFIKKINQEPVCVIQHTQTRACTHTRRGEKEQKRDFFFI